MTSSSLSALIGQRVLAAEPIHDYVQIRFTRGDVLNVFSALDLRDDGRPATLDDLVGMSVETAVEEPEFVRLTGGAVALRVDLTDVSFVGPEALHYIPAVGEQVVWN